MANELRVRALAVGGKVEDNPLAAAGVALTSAGLAALPAIGATQHLAITLDPDGLFGAPEIAWVTAHVIGTPTGTIARGQEGSTARQHDRDVDWIHGPTLWDFEVPRVRCKRTADSANLVAATWTTVAWDAEDVDTHAMHDTAGAPTRVTIVRAGDYRVSSTIAVAGNQTAGARLLKNGASGAVAGTVLPAVYVGNAGTPTGVGFSTRLRLAVGDYLEVQAISGGAVAVEADHSSFEVELVTMGEL